MLRDPDSLRNINREIRAKMNEAYSFAYQDMQTALRHEFDNRHDPLALPIFLGFFIEACFTKFWKSGQKKATLAGFREDALRRIEKTRLAQGKMLSGQAGRQIRTETRQEALGTYHLYSEAFLADLDRLAAFAGAHNKLNDLSEAAADQLFSEIDDIERAVVMLPARLHSYMRSCVWHIKKAVG